MRRTIRSVVTAGAIAAAATGFLTLGAGPAAADVGDGSLDCNRGEICFSRDATYFRYQKHFYNAGNHAGYVWTDIVTGFPTNRPIRNDASAVANRDTQCSVRVVNDRGLLPDSTITIPKNPGSVAWKYLGGINDQNDRHERVDC